jgi:TolA-binding protein
MESRQSGLSAFGANVRDALNGEDEAAGALAIRTAREALLDRAASGTLSPRREGWFRGRQGQIGQIAPIGWTRRIFVALAVTAAATSAVSIGLRRPLSFRVGPNGAPGRLGDLVEAPGSEPLAVQFSEGSSIVVAASGRVRVLAVEPVGAQVLVESGTADVAITHRATRKTSWRFEAGPFHVQVSGTRFRVGWSPKDQTFALDLREGTVVVSGACLEGQRTVGVGESLRLSCAPAPAASASPAAAPAVRAAAAAVLAAAPEPGAPPAEAPPAPAERPPVPAAPKTTMTHLDWRDLVRAGHYAEGLRAAERAGFDHACQTATENELVALADAARLSGRSARAMAALGTLRRRFPSTDGASTAAFALGRISFEQGQDYDSAVRWFSTYVSERPSGALIGDAVGRLMEARERAGDRSGARADAERYLRRFPEGPYARVARAILAE